MIFRLLAGLTLSITLAQGAAQAAECRTVPVCQPTLPALKKAEGFSSLYTTLIAKGKPMHRGRDVIALEGQELRAHAKFTYGVTDADLHKEPVDVYLGTACGTGWKKITTLTTSNDGDNPTIDGVEDTGGRVIVQLTRLGYNLAVGQHKLLFVVRGDNTMTQLNVDILPADKKIVISDIDGTLTASEYAAASQIVGVHPEAHPGAARTLKWLYENGYHIFYLTARPEWLMERTRLWLGAYGFPPGSVHTTLNKLGASGEKAAAYKTDELAQLMQNTGIRPDIAIGNKYTDVSAYESAGIPFNYYYKLDGDPAAGVIFDSYLSLLPEIQQIADACQ